MLPILAALSNEAVRWPAPNRPASRLPWFLDDRDFALQRAHEHPSRPKALRALIMYPMNALVEDQLTRLRRTLDSDEARAVMDSRFGGNRLYFGRYTGATPVTGFLDHPRRASLPDERRRRKSAISRLRKTLGEMAAGQDQARAHDGAEISRAAAEGRAPEDPTSFLFPSTDGSELVTRWDMQATPPDILVTNTSMLATMMVREVEAPIFEATKRWLEQDPDAYFFLVLDELHLIRGSAGMEIVGLLRTLFCRLGLDRAELRHKLRILASSASLPLEGDFATKSLRYLQDFFGQFGTTKAPGISTSDLSRCWEESIVSGQVHREEGVPSLPLDPAPFEALAASLGDGFDKFVPVSRLARTPELDADLNRASAALGVPGEVQSIADMLPRAIAKASAALTAACTAADSARPRATSLSDIATRIFGTPAAVDAVRGLGILRGLGDVCHREDLWGRQAPDGLATLRVHAFFRSIEGLFGSPWMDDQGHLRVSGLTVERGRTHAPCEDQVTRRLFELIY